MKADKKIILFGNSVILGIIGVSLQSCPGFEITKLMPSPERPQSLASLKPDILVFDSNTTQIDEVFPFLIINPVMLLIGISPDINLVKVWSIRELREGSMQDLIQVITSEAQNFQSTPGNNATSITNNV